MKTNTKISLLIAGVAAWMIARRKGIAGISGTHYRFSDGVDAERINRMADGRTIRWRNYITTDDGREFWLSNTINNNDAPYMELVVSDGRIYNVNLNNGIAYKI